MSLEILELRRRIHSDKIEEVREKLQQSNIFSDHEAELLRILVEMEINEFKGKYQQNIQLISKLDELIDNHSSFTEQYSLVATIKSLWKLGKLQEAQKLLTRHRNNLDFDSWIEHELTRQQAVILFLQGDVTTAITLIKKVIEGTGGLLQRAMARDNLGYFLRYQGENNLALKQHLKALPIFSRYKQLIPLANSLENIALINMAVGNLDEAMRRMEQSLELRKKIGNPFYLSWTLYHLIKLSRTSLEWDEIRKDYLSEMKSLQLGNNYSIIKSRYILAKAMTNNLDEEERHQIAKIRDNQELPSEIRLDAFIQMIEFQVQQLHEYFSNLGMEMVVDEIERLRDIGFDQSNIIITTYIHIFLAEIEKLQKNNQRAKHLLEQAKLLAKGTKNKLLFEEIVDIENKLARN